jgi:hypothetical protein
MGELSRRAFLYTGAGAAAAGAVIATTGGGVSGGGVSAGSAAAGSLSDSPAEAAEVAASVDGPIVVHIKDAKTGEVAIFSGDNEVIYRDPQLVARVARATHGSQRV